MARMMLTKRRVVAGVWEGVLTGAAGDQPPVLSVTVDQVEVPGITCTPDPEVADAWAVSFAVPADKIADGLQIFLITDATTGDQLGRFALQCDEGAPDELLAEVSLLRAELDMLKRAFRRHCVETGAVSAS